MKIDSFQGSNRFLSNFWPCKVELDGIIYPSTENAYQAAKTLHIKARIPLETCTPGQAKRAGQHFSIRSDWEQAKIQVMRDLLQQKFTKHEDLKLALLRTGTAELIEGNTWGDRFWGVCGGRGANHLGKLLMEIRDSITEQ